MLKDQLLSIISIYKRVLNGADNHTLSEEVLKAELQLDKFYVENGYFDIDTNEYLVELKEIIKLTTII